MGSVTNLVKTLTNPSNFVSRDHFLSSSLPVYLRTSFTEHPEVATRKPSYDLIINTGLGTSLGLLEFSQIFASVSGTR